MALCMTLGAIVEDWERRLRTGKDYGSLEDASAYHNRGITYRKQSKEASAQADFDKARQLGYGGSQ